MVKFVLVAVKGVIQLKGGRKEEEEGEGGGGRGKKKKHTVGTTDSLTQQAFRKFRTNIGGVSLLLCDLTERETHTQTRHNQIRLRFFRPRILQEWILQLRLSEIIRDRNKCS